MARLQTRNRRNSGDGVAGSAADAVSLFPVDTLFSSFQMHCALRATVSLATWVRNAEPFLSTQGMKTSALPLHPGLGSCLPLGAVVSVAVQSRHSLKGLGESQNCWSNVETAVPRTEDSKLIEQIPNPDPFSLP